MKERDSLEDAFEDLKEKIERMTINCKVELDEVVELQVEVAAFYKVLKSKCDKSELESPLISFENL